MIDLKFSMDPWIIIPYPGLETGAAFFDVERGVSVVVQYCHLKYLVPVLSGRSLSSSTPSKYSFDAFE